MSEFPREYLSMRRAAIDEIVRSLSNTQKDTFLIRLPEQHIADFNSVAGAAVLLGTDERHQIPWCSEEMTPLEKALHQTGNRVTVHVTRKEWPAKDGYYFHYRGSVHRGYKHIFEDPTHDHSYLRAMELGIE